MYKCLTNNCIKYYDYTIEEINKIWKELQHEKAHLEVQKNRLQEILQQAFEEVRFISRYLNVANIGLYMSSIIK
jgi:hypothetical protein